MRWRSGASMFLFSHNDGVVEADAEKTGSSTTSRTSTSPSSAAPSSNSATA